MHPHSRPPIFVMSFHFFYSRIVSCTRFLLQFGEVYMALYTPKAPEGSRDSDPLYVAVKTLKAEKGGINEEQKETLMAEVCIAHFCLHCNLSCQSTPRRFRSVFAVLRCKAPSTIQ